MSITKGIIHNGIANITQRAIRILDQLILVPFFSHSMGSGILWRMANFEYNSKHISLFRFRFWLRCVQWICFSLRLWK